VDALVTNGNPSAAACCASNARGSPCDRDRSAPSSSIVSSEMTCTPDSIASSSASAESFPPLQEHTPLSAVAARASAVSEALSITGDADEAIRWWTPNNACGAHHRLQRVKQVKHCHGARILQEIRWAPKLARSRRSYARAIAGGKVRGFFFGCPRWRLQWSRPDSQSNRQDPTHGSTDRLLRDPRRRRRTTTTPATNTRGEAQLRLIEAGPACLGLSLPDESVVPRRQLREDSSANVSACSPHPAFRRSEAMFSRVSNLVDRHARRMLLPAMIATVG
jgi:hypothetical protein